MRRLWWLLLVSCSGSVDVARQAVLVGRDDRREVYAHEDAWLRDLARQAVVTELDLSKLDLSNPLDIRSSEGTLTGPLCPDVPYVGQPTWGDCTGTLIDDDLVLTAGHCISASSCAGSGFAFNYLQDQPGVTHAITIDDLYYCRSVLTWGSDGAGDYALVQLDRPATPLHHPAPVRTAAKTRLEGTPLGVIGVPFGLPLKIDASGVADREPLVPTALFGFSSDSAPGNSGGPVIDLLDYTVVGVLTGSSDASYWVWDDAAGCAREKVVDHSVISGYYIQDELQTFCAGPLGASHPRLCGGAPRNDTPASAEVIAVQPGREQVIGGSTAGANVSMAGSCAAPSPDVFYRFALTQTSLVYADSFSSGFDTVLFFTHDTDHQTALYACNDDSCSGRMSQIVQLMTPGTYYLVVSGYGGASGRFNLHFQTLPVGGAGFTLPSTSGVITGNTSGQPNGVGPTCAFSSAPDQTYYYLTCPGAPTADNQLFSTCGGASWDTVLEYRSGNTPAQACVDDTWDCGRQSSFYATAASGSGLRAVSVDGYGGASGYFSLSYSLPDTQVHGDTPMQTPLRGAAGDVSFDRPCAAGSVVVGMKSYSAGGVVNFSLICAQVNADGSLVNERELAAAFSDAPAPSVLAHCPTGQFAVGLRSNSAVSAFGLTCAAPRPWLTGGVPSSDLLVAGNWPAGAPVVDYCYSGAALTGLSGMKSLASGVVSQLRGTCLDVY